VVNVIDERERQLDGYQWIFW